MNIILKRVFVACLLLLLLAGCFLFVFFNYRQCGLYHINYAYANHILKPNELGEILKRGLDEAECSALFGKNNPEISRDQDGQITHTYTYCYNVDLLKKLDKSSLDDHLLFFELVFSDYRLVNATEVRNAVPKAYCDYDSFGLYFSLGDSMNRIKEVLGEPKEIVYEEGKTRFKYVYSIEPKEMLFSKEHALICIKVFFKDEKLSNALFEINDVCLEQTGERLFFKMKCQRHYYLVDNNLKKTFGEEASVVSLLPLKQFGIHSIPQLKRKLSKMYIACEDPFSLSFKP